MNLKRTPLVFAGAACAALFAFPSLVVGYSLINGALGIGTGGNGYQRDIRCFNNAVDAAANNNNTPEAAHPGALGASLAIWKAAEVWNSNKEGQANFDYDWQGSATSNNANQNTVGWGDSGCGGGTLAYTETPTSDGWRIVMCESSWNWSDGPGNPGGGQIDIQGVAAHELGHALGLGHTGVSCSGACSGQSTMCAFLCGSGVDQRSLGNDDKNGLTAVYGSIPANKPLITGISGSTAPGGTLVISGSNFPSNVNVKFTAGSSLNTGSIPGVVFNQSASSSQVSVTIPSSAQDGNVLVWAPSISRLSNAFPIDIGSGGGTCTTPTNFGSGEVGSFSGQVAHLSANGLPSVSNPNFAIVLSGGNPNQTTWAIWGPVQTTQVVAWGTFLIGLPQTRMYVGQTNALGTLTFPFTVLPAMVGTTNYFQLVVRDNLGGGLQNSDGLTVVFCP